MRIAVDSAGVFLGPQYGTPADLALTRGPSIFNSSALGVRARTIPVPERALRGAANVAEAFGRIVRKRPPLNKKLVRQILAPGWVCDPSKARDRLGFVAQTPLSESLARAAASIAAVTRYLEEEMAVAPAAAPTPAPPWIPPGPALWALNGRQTQMQLRNLMQLRSLGRIG